MKTGMIATIIVVVLLVAIGAYFLMNKPAITPKGSGSNTGIINTSGSGSEAKTLTIDISNFAFSPATITINAGDIVVWTNNDAASHTVTSDSGSELASNTLLRGNTYSHTFNTAGTYRYHCTFHPGMKAKVIVQ